MGKKAKVGKARKDKFYHLAKETGYRSRAAFKLLQLNRKFEFLQTARVCIDLCAAPGGWLQVAAQHMPVSSLIVGVDLVGIKPIHNAVTFAEDITSEKCRQTLKKELQTWKADVVLHDGAPNVGQNWLHDAFQQAQLTLQALRLAVEFLRKGGWFVTKVFRSKDYHALLWVFNQLFKKVHATKPQASRNVSAEIFVVCQHFKAPDKIDPKFTDPKYVFKDVENEPRGYMNLIHPEKPNKKAEGYAEGDYTLHHKLSVMKFIQADNHMELLAACNQVDLDDPEIRDHPLTTIEIKACCEDIKLLGKKEIRSLLNWRKKLKLEIAKKEKEREEQEKMEVEGEDKDKENDTDEEEEIQKQVAEMKEEEKKVIKKKRKKVMKEKRKLRDRMSLNMVIPGDRLDITDDMSLFDLNKIKKKKTLKQVEAEDMPDDDDDEDDSDDEAKNNKRLTIAYDRHSNDPNRVSDDDEQSDEEEEEEDKELEFEPENEANSDLSDDEGGDEKDENPLVVPLESRDKRAKKTTEMWFNKEMFAGLDDDANEDMEIEQAVEAYKKKGGVVLDKSSSKKKAQKKDSNDSGHGSSSDESGDDSDTDLKKKSKVSNQDESDSDSEESSDESDSDSDLDDDAEMALLGGGVRQSTTQVTEGNKKTSLGNTKKDGFEIVPVDEPARKLIKLDPLELAIGEELVKSRKRRREIEELSYNRFTFNDNDLPSWFSRDENKHNRRQLPVTKDRIEFYKEKQKAIDARPIKKVAEAKARKKRKMTRRLERARKKAETVSDAVDVGDREKWKQIKEIYKKAGLLKKKDVEVTYVVAKKGVGKRVGRPAGVKGRFKVVDPRMRKDNMAAKKAARSVKKGKSKAPKGGKGGKPKGGKGKK